MARGLLDGEALAGESDLALALDLPEGMRALLLTQHSEGEDHAARLRRLDRALDQLPLRLTAEERGVAPVSSSPVRAGLAAIAAVLITADRDELTHLKACRRDPCQWVFYDASRNRQGSWCSMDICGARTTMRRYRARRREGA